MTRNLQEEAKQLLIEDWKKEGLDIELTCVSDRITSIRIKKDDYDIDHMVRLVGERLAKMDEITQVDLTKRNEVIFTFRTNVIAEIFEGRDLL